MATDRGGQADLSFDEFFFRMLPRVLKLARRLTGNPQAAEDVAAEAFARAFARWPRISSLPYRDAWVLRVATNLAIDAARKQARTQPPVTGDDFIDLADLVAVRTTLVQALTNLSRVQRQAVVLRYLVDLPEDQVAAALHIRPGTVKSHLHRATKALRRAIGTDPKDLEYDPHPA